MIVILYQTECEAHADRAKADVAAAFNDSINITTTSAEAPSAWPGEPSWDDLLLVFFNDASFPVEGCDYIIKYLESRGEAARVLPIAIQPTPRVLPAPISSIKALLYGADSPGVNGRIVSRIGAMLNLRLQGRQAKIFLSYRASDGTKIAAQLHRYMTDLGYRPWLDEAKDLDEDVMILPGTLVQEQIDTALEEASLVLLIDTPDAPQSRWIKHEIDGADGLLLPILPICFRSIADKKVGPRFASLLALQRWISLPLPDLANAEPLSITSLESIVHTTEEYLCEILRRKCRVPHLVQKEFRSKGFSWDVLDARQSMYRSSRPRGSRLTTEVLNHCSLFDQVYAPALQAFSEFLQSAQWAHYPLFVYDGDLLPEREVAEIVRARANERVIVLHHQELATFIASNFTVLGRA